MKQAFYQGAHVASKNRWVATVCIISSLLNYMAMWLVPHQEQHNRWYDRWYLFFREEISFDNLIEASQVCTELAAEICSGVGHFLLPL